MPTNIIRRAPLVILLGLGLIATATPAAQAVPPAPVIEAAGVDGNGPSDPEPYLTGYFRGTAQASSTVRLYGDAACAGAVLAETKADSYGNWGVKVAAQPGQTITGYANATDGTGTSLCSTTTATYSVPPRPDTKLTKTPKKVVKYNVRSLPDGTYVTFKYTSTVPSANRFKCTINGKAVACSGHKINLLVKTGKQTFTVAAVDDHAYGLVDQSPAVFKFKVKNKKK